MTPHKHHDVIIAWAKGATIQYRDPNTSSEWHTLGPHAAIGWYNYLEYRIKPEPKPDIIHLVHVNNMGYVWNRGTGVWQNEFKNLRLILDGETGVLKKAEVINEA